jgi:hypothetical protein
MKVVLVANYAVSSRVLLAVMMRNIDKLTDFALELVAGFADVYSGDHVLATLAEL